MHTRLLALAGLSALLLATAHAQRTDNRRLFWTGSHGADWSGSSWQTSGSFLAYANTAIASPVWSTTLPDADGTPVEALAATPFIIGDVAIFDSVTDDPGARTITIAADGVTASDIVVSGAGDYVFTGGAITADPALALGSVQLTGTGVAPAGRLLKLNTGDLTLSNTAPNRFAGGILLAAGTLTIADPRALGDNSVALFPATHAATGAIALPAIVTTAGGALLREAATLIAPVTLRVPAAAAGLDITGGIHLASQILTLDIEGDTTISGPLTGAAGTQGATGGAIAKTGTGTLTLSGTRNWFYGTSTVAAGRLVVTSPYAIGSGNMAVTTGTLVFHGVTGTMPMSFIGGGRIEVTGASDLVFNWHSGALAGATTTNFLSTLHVTGASRFSAIASGTLSGVLGGADATVIIEDRSTLVLGREGLSSRGTLAAGLPMTYPILAKRITLTGSSSLVFNPNAFLQTATLELTDGSAITFSASGVSRLHYIDGTDPGDLSYRLPDGLTLITNPIPVSNGQSIEYVVVNQGANPLKDIAMTAAALDALHDTISSRLADHFLHPPAPQTPARRRHWINSAWTRYLDSRVDYETGSAATQPGHSGRLNGLALGLDATLDGRLLAGLYAAAAENNLDTTNHTSLSTKQKLLGLYLALRFGRFHLAADASTGRARTDSLRYEAADLTRGKWETSYYAGALEAGFTLTPWNAAHLRPFAAVRYTKLKITDHYERGPSPLIINDFDDALGQALYGARLGQTFTLFKRPITADLTLARKHTINTPRETLITHYYDSPDTPVTLERGDYYTDTIAIAIALRAALTPHTYAALSYDHETASTRTRHTASLTVAYTW
jgi:autotransporter-associated beta strand protein